MEQLRLLLPKTLLDDIDNFRFVRRFDSRLKAIRHLIEWALHNYPDAIDDNNQPKGIERVYYLDDGELKEIHVKDFEKERKKKEDIISRFDVDGELQIVNEINGLYVVGEGIVKQVSTLEEGDAFIEKYYKKGNSE